MAKVLFSADWHIKLGQKNVPRDWQKNRFRLLYDQINSIVEEHQIDFHIIGGDIFDSIPKLEELQLFAEFLFANKTPTYIFDGNHEASKKGKTFFEFLKPIIERIGNAYVILGSDDIGFNIDVIPYTDLKTFDPKNFSNDILVTHVRGDIPPHVKAEIDLSKFDRWNTVFAGDLHSHTNSQRNIVYPGSPMTVTFHRNPTKTGVIIFDTETIEWEWIPLKLPQLIRKTVESEDEMIPTDYDHTIYELTGDLQDLAKVKKANPLLDKKVVKRKVDAKIDFSNTKTIVEELNLYLKEVKGLDSTDKTIKTYNDHIQGTKLE